MIVDVLLAVCLGAYIVASLSLLVYGINSYVLIIMYLRNRSREQLEQKNILSEFAANYSDDDLPVITTQLPIFNERNVIERLLRAVCDFDYPTDRHEIQILDDSTDETVEFVADLVERLCAEGHDIKHLYRSDRAGYKAGALEAGMKVARGEFVAIFDADFVPPADFLRRTVPFLMADERCGFVQTRWGHRNPNFSWLTRLQSIGIDGHFGVEQAARAWGGMFWNFNGTAGIWRVKTIEESGGWQPRTLTEDLDLSYRAQLAGWQPRYLRETVTPAEVPTDINALKSQQRRWAKGSIQTAMLLMPKVWRATDTSVFKKVQASLHLTHYLIHPMILLMTVLVLPLVGLLQQDFATPFTASLVSVMLVALFGPSTLYVVSQVTSGQSGWRAVVMMPALVALGIGLAVNNSRAVIEALAGSRGGEFVRTPKLGSAAEQDGPLNQKKNKMYRQPMDRFCMLELVMGGWALLAFISYCLVVGSLGGVLLLVQAAGFLIVGGLSVSHHLRAGKSIC